MADPVLETRRLILRPPATSDLPFVLKRMNTAAVMRYLGGHPRPRADVEASLQADIAAFASGDWRRWTVWLRDGDCPVGRCGLFRVRSDAAPADLRGQLEIGWTFAQEYWGQGYASEAAGAVLDFAFGTLGWPVIYSQTSDSNAASTRMMHRLGFTARPDLGYDDSGYPPEDNPTTVWALATQDYRANG